MTTAEAEIKKSGEEEGDEHEVQELKYYLYPGNCYVIIEKEWVLFTGVTGLVYLIHLFWMCYGVDVYASYERHVKCGGNTTNEENSAVYDTWILLCVIFHMIEWIRQTIFATSALVGVNLVPVFYGLYVMIPFGIIVMLGGGIAAASSDSDCQEKQSARSTYLLLQFLALVLTLGTCCLHMLIFKMKGADWCNEILYREDDDEDD